MKVFKLAKSELKKIFLKPIMLVAFFVVIATLVVTTFTFSPAPKEKTTVTLGGTNIISLYNTFTTSATEQNSKTNLDDKLSKEYQWVSQYFTKIQTKSELESLNAKIAATDADMQQLHRDVLSYCNNTGTTQNEVRERFRLLATKASETYNYLNNLSDISFYLSLSDFDTLSKFFEGIAKNIPSVFVNPDVQFPQINNFLSENYNFKQISEITQNLKVFEINKEKYDELIQNFYTEIYPTDNETKLGKLFEEIKDFALANSDSTLPEDFEKFNNLVSNYKSIVVMSSNALKNGWIVQLAGNKSDNELHEFIGFANYNSYIYKQEVAKNEYLLKIGKFDYQFLEPMSFNRNSGEKTNVFDFLVFAMQIVSFVLAIIVIFVASGTVATELSNGTMKMLAIRPYSRNKIILAKFLACIMFMIMMVLMAFVISFAVGFFTYGIGATNVLVVFNSSKVIEMNVFVVTILYLLSCILNLIFYISLSILVSILFKSNVISVIVGLLTYGISIIFNALLYAKNWMVYLPFAHFDLFKYFGSVVNNGDFFGFSLANGGTFTISIIYLLICILLNIFASTFIFRKRNIA